MWPFRHVTKAAQADMIGLLRSLHTGFYFPFKDRSKYPLRPEAEPMRTLGEMDRYSMPAVVENGPSGRAKTVFVSLNGPQETVGSVRTHRG